MPQTLEHLAVLEHLGIAAGIPVVTKADLVEPEWLDLVLLEVAERLASMGIPWEAFSDEAAPGQIHHQRIPPSGGRRE
jgi:selenocysteine-specific translation elongation factor